VLTRFDPNRVGLTLEAFTEVALFLASIRSFFDFYAQQPKPQSFGQPGQPPMSQGPPGITPTNATISLNFDQLVTATPYFL
jgi:hypothetical protein